MLPDEFLKEIAEIKNSPEHKSQKSKEQFLNQFTQLSTQNTTQITSNTVDGDPKEVNKALTFNILENIGESNKSDFEILHKGKNRFPLDFGQNGVDQDDDDSS